MLDSSILVEYIKDDRKVLLEEMLIRNLELSYNSVLVSEYLYYFVGYYGKKAPRTLKESNRVASVLAEQNPMELLTYFTQITNSHPSTQDVVRLMKTYNMLPNDAIILAHCLSAGIKFLASYDLTDFTIPCREEGIVLLDSIEVLNHYFPVS